MAAQSGFAGMLRHGFGVEEEIGFDVNYILDQALRWHVSSVNVSRSPIPADWKPQFEAFQKKMGYRFILRRLEYPKTGAAGSMMPMHMWWLNAGVAPHYRNIRWP